MNEIDNTTLTLLFKLGHDTYGLEIDAIQEIVEDPVEHVVPKAGGVVRGAINFHGNILAVIDLPVLLAIPEGRRDRRRLVLTPALRALVLTITELERISKLDLSTLQPPTQEHAGRAVRGMLSHENRTVHLLDIGIVLQKLDTLSLD
jgi:purine-binding chemotaxis protein CheW